MQDDWAYRVCPGTAWRRMRALASACGQPAACWLGRPWRVWQHAAAPRPRACRPATSGVLPVGERGGRRALWGSERCRLELAACSSCLAGRPACARSSAAGARSPHTPTVVQPTPSWVCGAGRGGGAWWAGSGRAGWGRGRRIPARPASRSRVACAGRPSRPGGRGACAGPTPAATAPCAPARTACTSWRASPAARVVPQTSGAMPRLTRPRATAGAPPWRARRAPVHQPCGQGRLLRPEERAAAGGGTCAWWAILSLGIWWHLRPGCVRLAK